MAEERVEKKSGKKVEFTFATKSGMVVSDKYPEYRHEGTGCKLDILAKDDVGYYLTSKSYAQSKLLDPFRMYHRIEPDCSWMTANGLITDQPKEVVQ